MFPSKIKYSIFPAAVFALSLPFNAANATNGMNSAGYGLAAKGMAGVAAALSDDTLTGATNPAAMVKLGNRVDGGINFFNPNRSITAETGAGAIPTGRYESAEPWFIVPEFGFNKMLDDDSSIGVTLNANGGMNTEYGTNPFRAFNAAESSSRTGVDMAQALLGVTYAKRSGMHSFGVTPTLAFQYFSAYGLQDFAGNSSNPNFLTNRGYDYSFGYGMRIGYQGQLGPDITLGAAYQSKMRMQKFDKYKGLFADGGSFDMAPIFTFGLAYQIPETKLTLAGDYQRIMYGSIDAIANSGNNLGNCSGGITGLGGSKGCGFGWDNQNIVKLGASYDVTDELTLRAGGSWNSQVYENDETLFNILAPAVVRIHASVGASYEFMDNQSLSFAYTRALDDSITGVHVSSPQNVKHQMDQHEIGIGYTYKW